MTLSPVQEAQYALDFGVDRNGLKPDAQAEYDRLVAARAAGTPVPAVPYDPLAGVTMRTPPETRERILAMFKKANSKYGKPFDKDRLAGVSVIGSESWAEYGSVVLQMAILDTLLSIEEKLEKVAGAVPDSVRETGQEEAPSVNRSSMQ